MAARIPTRSGGALTLAIIGLLVLALSVFAYGPTLNPLDLLFGRPVFIEAPDVVGLSQPAAVLEATSLGLSSDVEFGFYNDVPRGQVAEQRPVAGDAIESDGHLALVVSRGPAIIEVPDLVGKNEKAMLGVLSEAGLDPKVDRVNNEDAVAGTILAQGLRPGRVVRGGTELPLTVSLGPVERPVPVTGGLPLEGALFRIGQAGLLLGEVLMRDDPSAPKNAVIGTEPGVGVVVAKDTKIRVVVSAGPPPVNVPRLVGTDDDVAKQRLADLGLVIGEVAEIGSVGDPQDGVVLAQMPAEGTSLRPGEVVTITVRRAAPAPTTTAPPVTNPPATTTTERPADSGTTSSTSEP